MAANVSLLTAFVAGILSVSSPCVPLSQAAPFPLKEGAPATCAG
jgi:hypothetical protein